MNGALSYCHICAADLRAAPKVEAVSYNKGATELLLKASLALTENQGLSAVWNLDLYSVMHQLCRVMTEGTGSVALMIGRRNFPEKV